MRIQCLLICHSLWVECHWAPYIQNKVEDSHLDLALAREPSNRFLLDLGLEGLLGGPSLVSNAYQVGILF